MIRRQGLLPRLRAPVVELLNYSLEIVSTY